MFQLFTGTLFYPCYVFYSTYDAFRYRPTHHGNFAIEFSETLSKWALNGSSNPKLHVGGKCFFNGVLWSQTLRFPSKSYRGQNAYAKSRSVQNHHHHLLNRQKAFPSMHFARDPPLFSKGQYALKAKRHCSNQNRSSWKTSTKYPVGWLRAFQERTDGKFQTLHQQR